MKHRQLLYVSRLAPDASASTVPQIVRTARARNASHGITGMLVFDGECFAQYIEGPLSAMAELIDGLATDKRHVGMSVLYDAVCPPIRHMQTWSMAYAYSRDRLNDLATKRGEAALAYWFDLMHTVDLEP